MLAVGSSLTGTMHSYAAAIACWALTGAGSAVVFAGLYAYLLQTVPKSEMARVLGLFYGSFNVGIIAGGPVGGILAHAAGLSAPFYAYSVLLVAASLLYIAVIEPPPRRPREEGGTMPFRRALRSLMAERGFVTACLGSLGYLWLVAGVFDTLLPLKSKLDLGMSTLGIGALFGVVTAAELVTLYPAGTLADRVGRIKVLLPSTVLVAVLTVAAGFASSVIVFAVLLCAMCFASGFSGVPPAAMLSDVVPDHLSGTGVGIFRFAGDLGFVFGPLLAGWAAGPLGFPAAFAVCAAPLVVLVGFALRTPETLHAQEVSPALLHGGPGGAPE